MAENIKGWFIALGFTFLGVQGLLFLPDGGGPMMWFFLGLGALGLIALTAKWIHLSVTRSVLLEMLEPNERIETAGYVDAAFADDSRPRGSLSWRPSIIFQSMVREFAREKGINVPGECGLTAMTAVSKTARRGSIPRSPANSPFV